MPARLVPLGWLALAALCALLGTGQPARAQASLLLVDEETTVGDIEFAFTGTQTFEAGELKEQIALTEPGFLDKVRRVLPLLSPAPHPFAPLVLQQDVARLRQFYEDNGFLQAEIDYPETSLDTTGNTIDVVFTITEGPPLIIQDVRFVGPDTSSYAVAQFEGEVREAWIAFRDQNTFQTGERYTEFKRMRIEDTVLAGLQNNGFAFAQTGAVVEVDSSANTADIRFVIDAGPRARVGEIEIEGNDSVAEDVVRRELPLEEGDWFSYDELIQGQRQLFGLNLFRLALADVPPQPRDSSVAVRYRVREASLRYVTAETGYGRLLGLTAQGQWTHRNFFGSARTFSASAVANTGALAAGDDLTRSSRLFRGALTLNQPYLFVPNLSLLVSPFIQYEKSALLAESERPLGINLRQYGLNTTLIYELVPFRTVSLQHNYSRIQTFTRELVESDTLGLVQTPSARYDRSVLTLAATLGRADDYINPTQGFLVRPFVELGGGPLQGDLTYAKLGNEVSGYLPLGEQVSLAGRLVGGTLFYDARRDTSAAYENRFDPIRFYAGGPNDVRGWQPQLAGAKRPVLDLTAEVIQNENQMDSIAVDTLGYAYEPVGGRYKLAYNIEARLPFPGLGSEWATAVFLDAGMVSDAFALQNVRYGAGAGIRYRTPVGYLRLDLAAKLNPTVEDLSTPEDVYQWRFQDGPYPDTQWWRRFRIHISIGQAF